MIGAKQFPRFCFIAAVLLSLILAVQGCGNKSSAGSSSSGYVHVEAGEAAEMIASGKYLPVDVRTEIPYGMGHIPGAVNLPYDQVSDDPDEEISLLPDKNQPLILYCDYGVSSKEVAEKLAAKGYTDLAEFDGLRVWEGELTKD